MPKPKPSPLAWTRIVRIALVLALLGYVFYTAQQRQQRQPQQLPDGPVAVQPQPPSATDERFVVPNVKVQYEDDGRIVTWHGDVDLTGTVARIRRGARLQRWENDGDVFGNFEGLLPKQRRGYYREWVHPTPQAPGPGPQRVVSGADGDLWYTADHYESFIELKGAEAKASER